jgi:hypothetical protein
MNSLEDAYLNIALEEERKKKDLNVSNFFNDNSSPYSQDESIDIETTRLLSA